MVVRPATKMEYYVMRRLLEQRQDLIEALRAMVALYDRRDDSGWIPAEVERLAEIRALVKKHENTF